MLGTAKIATDIPLHKYQIYTRENQNKTSLDSNQESNKSNETDLNTDNKDMQ